MAIQMFIGKLDRVSHEMSWIHARTVCRNVCDDLGSVYGHTQITYGRSTIHDPDPIRPPRSKIHFPFPASAPSNDTAEEWILMRSPVRERCCEMATVSCMNCERVSTCTRSSRSRLRVKKRVQASLTSTDAPLAALASTNNSKGPSQIGRAHV